MSQQLQRLLSEPQLILYFHLALLMSMESYAIVGTRKSRMYICISAYNCFLAQKYL
ncbi:hypothetical protein RDABS01_039316 [Bienertia sinuspersici]